VTNRLAACGSDGSDQVAQTGDTSSTSTTAAADTGGDVEGPEWVLDPADASFDVPDGATITLRVADGDGTITLVATAAAAPQD